MTIQYTPQQKRELRKMAALFREARQHVPVSPGVCFALNRATNGNFKDSGIGNCKSLLRRSLGGKMWLEDWWRARGISRLTHDQRREARLRWVDEIINALDAASK